MKPIIKLFLLIMFPIALPIIAGWWILEDGESLPDLVRAYFDNVNML